MPMSLYGALTVCGGYSTWCLIAAIYKLHVGSVNRLISKRYSCDSFPDNENLIQVKHCQPESMSIRADKISQNSVNGQLQLHRTLIAHEARPELVDS
jgi:hypothetical protein